MAQALQDQIKNPEAGSLSFEERLAMVVDAQWLCRENRATASRLRRARLKEAASIEDINYRHPRQLDRALMRSLASCDWIRQHHNVTISGPSGVGKTYLCCALLEKACREGFSAYWSIASFSLLGHALDRPRGSESYPPHVAFDDSNWPRVQPCRISERLILGSNMRHGGHLPTVPIRIRGGLDKALQVRHLQRG